MISSIFNGLYGLLQFLIIYSWSCFILRENNNNYKILYWIEAKDIEIVENYSTMHNHNHLYTFDLNKSD